MLFCRNGCSKLQTIKRGLEKFTPLVDLSARLIMAYAFWRSGKLKLDSYFDNNWDATVALFRDVHPVPFLPAEIAAVLGTAGEVGLSLLLAIGLFSRFAAAGLIFMTLVIISTGIVPFTLLAQAQHIMWITLLGFTLTRGPGPLSLDALLCRKMQCGDKQ